VAHSSSTSPAAAYLIYPSGQVRTQPGLQRPAFADRPGRHQVGDVFQGHPDPLGPADERQLIQRRLIEHPVAVGGPPRGRQQPGTLIEAHCRRCHPGAFGQFRDSQTVHESKRKPGTQLQGQGMVLSGGTRQVLCCPMVEGSGK
jgi:hypothetical protein